MILIHDLQFSWPRDGFRLSIPELSISAGETVAITGASGCGKTTLLNLIAGICLPQSGTLRVADTVISDLPDAARREFRLRNAGLVFQDFRLIEYLTTYDNVLLPCRLSPAVNPTADFRARASALLAQAGLSAHSRKSVTRLSQGERQRVAICRAILLRPPLLLADEPTGNLDPETAEQILNLLLNQAAEHGATLVMVTHDRSLLSRFRRVIAFESFRRGPDGAGP